VSRSSGQGSAGRSFFGSEGACSCSRSLAAGAVHCLGKALASVQFVAREQFSPSADSMVSLSFSSEQVLWIFGLLSSIGG
jgi:hypothetical protein